MSSVPYPSNMNHSGGNAVKPLWSIKFEDNEEFLGWFKEAADALATDHAAMTEGDMRRRDFYMGLQSIAQGRDGIPRDREGKPLQKFARVTINQCYELIEQWVSKMTRYPPAIAVLPSNKENNDRIAAKMSKAFIDYLFYVNDIDDVLEEVARNCRIDGEAYLFVGWNKNIGDYAPGYVEAQSLGIRPPLLNSSGEQILNSDKEPMFIDKAQRVGDVEYRVKERRYMLLQPKTRWKEVEWCVEISTADVDELKAEHPDLADQIGEKASPGQTFGFNLFRADEDWNEVLVYNLYHKSTTFLDKGRHIKFCDGVVLENKELEYSHGELPFIRLTNIDVPGILRGQSFLDHIMLLQVMYNNLASIAYTNFALGAHLYWMVPAQAGVDLRRLKNSNSVIRYMGGVPPTLQQFRTVGAEMFEGLKFVNDSIQRISGIQGVSRGEPPAGIEAGVALAFLEEQENQRANTDIKKHNAFIKKLARFSLAVAGDFYDPADGRTIRIVGKNNQFSVKALDVAKLGGPYDIRVQRTTALSESKSGRLSQILALEGRFPGKVPWEQVADMLDLANDEKYYSIATVAVQAQERENEEMGEGHPVAAPVEYEDHLTHYFSLRKAMQPASFKEDMPEDRKRLFIEHGMGHEFFIAQKMTNNPIFTQLVMSQFPDFPVFVLPSGPTIAPVPSSPLEEALGASMGGGGMQPDLSGMMPTGDEQGNAAPEPPGEDSATPEPMPLAPPSPAEGPNPMPPEQR